MESREGQAKQVFASSYDPKGMDTIFFFWNTYDVSHSIDETCPWSEVILAVGEKIETAIWICDDWYRPNE